MVAHLSVEALLEEQIARHRALNDSFVFARIQFAPAVDPEEAILHLRRFIKRSDIVLRAPGGVFVLFPHTPGAYLPRIEERLKDILAGRASQVVLKAYPDDGSTPQDLLQGAPPRRLVATRAEDAWGVYYASPIKMLQRAHERARDGQALAVKLHGHPWTEPGRLLDHFLEKIRREVRVVDLSVLAGESVDFELWREFFAELSQELTPRSIARSIQDIYTVWVVRSPQNLPKEAFPFLRAIWNALPPGTSLLFLFVQEAETAFAHQVAFEQFLRLSDALIEVHLYPLSREDFLHMARNVLALSLPQEEFEEKYALSGGYPALLFPILDQSPAFFYRLLAPPPEALRQATERARGVMKPSLFQFLQTLSVLGPSFTQEFAQSLFASEDPAKLRTFLERAESAGWLVREDRRWRFAPPLFWKGLYALLPAPARRKFHKLVFDRFQARTLESQDPLFLLQMVWHAWGMEEPGAALSIFPALLHAHPEKHVVHAWLEGFLDDFQDAPLPYPALEQTLSSAVSILLAQGDGRAVSLAEKLVEQAMGADARARAALFVMETRIQLGDVAFLEKVLDGEAERIFAGSPEFQHRATLRRCAALWLSGKAREAREMLVGTRKALFDMAARSRGTLPLFLDRLFGELHTLEAALALVEGNPRQVEPLLNQAARRARPEGFSRFLVREIQGFGAFLLGNMTPPEGEDLQSEIWRAYHAFVRGEWRDLRAKSERWKSSHSRYGLMARLLLAWMDAVQRLEPPPPSAPEEPVWMQALGAWLATMVAWVKGETPPSREVPVDEGHVPARVFAGMAQMVDRPDLLPHLLPLTEAYPVLRVLLLEWAGWLGYRRDAALVSLAREVGSPWLEARAAALLGTASPSLVEREDQWALKALERIRRTVQ